MALDPVVTIHGRRGLPVTRTRPLWVEAANRPSTPVTVMALEPVSTSTSPSLTNEAVTRPLCVLTTKPPLTRATSIPLLEVVTLSGPAPSTDTAADPISISVSPTATSVVALECAPRPPRVHLRREERPDQECRHRDP